VLKAIRGSKGVAVSVDDADILLAEKEIARLEGIWLNRLPQQPLPLYQN